MNKMASTEEGHLAFVIILLIAIMIAMCSGCVYHKEIEKVDGAKETLHIGFPQFSDDKDISLIKF